MDIYIQCKADLWYDHLQCYPIYIKNNLLCIVTVHYCYYTYEGNKYWNYSLPYLMHVHWICYFFNRIAIMQNCVPKYVVQYTRLEIKNFFLTGPYGRTFIKYNIIIFMIRLNKNRLIFTSLKWFLQVKLPWY